MTKEDQLMLLFNQFAKMSKVVATATTSNAVIYTRVSSKEQAMENMSLETQKEYCEAYALKQNYEVLGYFGGTYESAKTDERREFNRMMDFVKKCKQKVSYIIVFSVDRFSRTGGNGMYIKDQLKKRGILIQSVTQPADAATPAGDLQQNIHFVFAEYENLIRAMRCQAGIKKSLSNGDWVSRPPLGYVRIKREKYEKGERKWDIVMDEKGKLLRKAFLWKAHEGLSSAEILARLESLGLKLHPQKISEIFRNPFYCGVLVHGALDGKVVPGNHEKLISKEVFLKVNNLLQNNSQGYTVKQDNDSIPLKSFIRCSNCGQNMPGYIVKKKGLWYYKCRKKGCCNNVSAKQLHGVFRDALESMRINGQFIPVLKEQIKKTYSSLTKDSELQSQQQKKLVREIEKKLERLEERFVMEEINKEIYEKYRAKFSQEIQEIEQQLDQSSWKVSNLDECIDFAIEYGRNLPLMWDSANYKDKRRLQYLLFPDGIIYDKKSGQCRTERINSVFLSMALQSRVLSKEKPGIPALNVSYSGLVAET